MDWEQEALPNNASPRLEASVPSSTSDGSPMSPKKRKFSSESEEGARFGSKASAADEKALQDRSHSVVEKRYRENLNQKIADLGDCVPNLRRTGAKKGASASQKRNKATVLTEAMSYIQQLEKRNAYLEEVNATMNDQIQQQGRTIRSETIASDESRSESQEETPEASSAIAEEGFTHNEPRGMIPVPDAMRRLWRNQSQEHYMAEPNETSSGNIHIKGGKYLGRTVVGSLAGFMVLDGFASPHARFEKREDRGLSAVPWPYMFPNLRRVIPDHHGISLLPSSFLLSQASKAFFIFGLLGLLLFLYLYYSKPPTPPKSKTPSVPLPTPSLRVGVRQNAFLTSIQTVWVPRHHIFPEMIALVLGTGSYLARQILGWRYYLWFTGRSEEDEKADIRAWDIAIDAQLSGGDPEVSKGRLTLTLWAAGTLPSTPARLMLKALHIRVLFWQPSHFETVSLIMHTIARLLASNQWNKASGLQDRLKSVSKPVGLGQSDPLPDHLKSLLESSADEILNDNVIQRAHSIVWNYPNNHAANDAVDSTVEDSATQGPLDLVASQFSSSRLQTALLRSLKNAKEIDLVRSDLDLAVRTAPPRSTTSACALVAREVFVSARCGFSLSSVTWAFPPCFSSGELPPASTSGIEIQIIVAGYCGLALRETDCHTVIIAAHLSHALQLICHRPADIGLLSSATTSYTLSVIFSNLNIKGKQLDGLREDMMEAIVRAKEIGTSNVGAESAARKTLCEALQRALQSTAEGSRRRTPNASSDVESILSF